MFDVRCPFCREISRFKATAPHVVEDGDILWDMCDWCWCAISLDLIITIRDGEDDNE